MKVFTVFFILVLAFASNPIKAEELNLNLLAENNSVDNPTARFETNESNADINDNKESTGIFDLLFGSLDNEENSEKTDENNETKKNEKSFNKHLEPGHYFDSATIKAIDRSIGKLYVLNITTNKPMEFEDLNIRIISCWQQAAKTLLPDSRAFIDIETTNSQNQKEFIPKKIYQGWIIANSPAAAFIKHPKFDISLLECKNQAKIAEPAVKHPN